jgi:hypothetical protein
VAWGVSRDRLPINPHGADVTEGPWRSTPRWDHKQAIVRADERKLFAVRRAGGRTAAGQTPGLPPPDAISSIQPR